MRREFLVFDSLDISVGVLLGDSRRSIRVSGEYVLRRAADEDSIPSWGLVEGRDHFLYRGNFFIEWFAGFGVYIVVFIALGVEVSYFNGDDATIRQGWKRRLLREFNGQEHAS